MSGEELLVLGDAHADEADKRDALLSAYAESDADRALQVGDLMHYDLPRLTWFVAGNNEDFDVIEVLRAGRRPDGVANAHLLASDVAEVGGLRVAGLSGNYAPSRYDYDRTALDGERRRHFTHEDIERALELTDVDVLLTHAAPHGLGVTEDYDPGCEHVDRLLSALDPDLCLVGHHHEHTDQRVGGRRVVSLAPTWEGYYTLEAGSLALTWHAREA